MSVDKSPIKLGLGNGGGAYYDPGATSPGYNNNDGLGLIGNVGFSGGVGANIGIPGGVSAGTQGGFAAGQKVTVHGVDGLKVAG